MSTASHPPTEVLFAFLQGRLSGAEADAVEEHLASCPACSATTLPPDDALIRLAREAGLADTSPPGPQTPGGEGPRSAPPSTDVDAAAVANTEAGAGVGPDLAAHANVPGYEILGELGRGGMSVVYKARQARPARLVALKMVLGGDRAGPQQRARFLVEVDAIARLQHPNIVQIFEAGFVGDVPFFSLELAEGGSLAARLAGSPQPPRQAASLARALAGAVHYAHQRGVVHRDLKPGNVLLTPDGVPKVADFGLARLEREPLADGDGEQAPAHAPAHTVSGAVLGTPSYMAPEQAQGRNNEVGAPADTYALGAVLYECLTGRPPFRAASPLDTLLQVLADEPAPPRQLNPSVPRDLETICLKCLQKSPARRYASAADLADDLGRFLDGKPIQARPVPALERGWRWCRRRPAVAGLLLMVAALLVLLTVGTLVKNADLSLALKEAHEARRKADEELWKSYLAEARAGRFSGRSGQRIEGLAAIRKALALPVPQGHSLDELRNEAIACLCLPDLEELRRWQGLPEGTVGPSFDGPLETYLRATPAGEISVRRVADDAEVAHFKTNQAGGQLSPDGRFVVVGPDTAGTLELWQLEGGGARRCLSEPSAHRYFACFSPDSRLFAYRCADTLVIRDLAAGRAVAEWPVSGRSLFWALAFSPEGDRLAFGLAEGGQNLVHVRKVPTGEVLARLPQPHRCTGIVWHPDGERLAVGCEDRRIHFWDVAAQKELSSWEGHRNPGIQFLAIDRAGSQLASFAWDGRLRLWDVESGEQVFSAPLSFFDGWTARSGTGQGMRIVSREGRHDLRLLRVIGGREHRKLAYCTPGGRIRYHRFLSSSPDGRFLVIETEDPSGSGAIVEVETGRRVGLLPASAGGILRPLGVDRSGGLLVYDQERYGLVRWPVRADAGAGVRFGPPRRLLWERGGWGWGASADGQVIAIPKGNGAVVVSLTAPRHRLVLPGQVDVRSCAVSPDGRFTATGSHHTPAGQPGSRIWRAADGKLLEKLPLGTLVSALKFSPDGGWLGTASNGGGTRLWRTPTWEEGPLLDETPRGFAFAPDGLTVAVGKEGGVRLCVTESGRELARLECPDQTNIDPVAFSRDGARLFAHDGEGYIHVWDLRQIRRGLAELGLDWDAPPLPEPTAGPWRPLRVEVDRGALASFAVPPGETSAQRVERCTLLLRADPDDIEAYHQRAHAYEALGKHALAIADFTEALKRQPDDDHFLAWRGRDHLRLKQFEAGVDDLERSLALKKDQADLCDVLARVRARGPERLRAPKAALALAKRAVELAPKEVRYRATLGIALYHNDRAGDAVALLEESLKEAKGLDPALHLFYLAMCHQQLGEAVKAKDAFDRAVRWRAGQKSLPAAQAALFRSYQADAAKALGLEPGPARE